MGLNGYLVCADALISFEGTLMAGEDDDLAFLTKPIKYLDQSLITIIVEVHKDIIKNCRKGLGSAFVFFN